MKDHLHIYPHFSTSSFFAALTYSPLLPPSYLLSLTSSLISSQPLSLHLPYSFILLSLSLHLSPTLAPSPSHPLLLLSSPLLLSLPSILPALPLLCQLQNVVMLHVDFVPISLCCRCPRRWGGRSFSHIGADTLPWGSAVWTKSSCSISLVVFSLLYCL